VELESGVIGPGPVMLELGAPQDNPDMWHMGLGESGLDYITRYKDYSPK
jgi:hypothetical protein